MPNYPTIAHVKLDTHWISFDGGSPLIKGFRLRAGVLPLYACISLSIGGTILS